MPEFSNPNVFTNDSTATSGSVTVGDTTWSWSGGTICAPEDFADVYPISNTIVYNTTVSTGESSVHNRGNCYFINSVLDKCVVEPATADNSHGIFGSCHFVNSTVSDCSGKNMRGIIYGSVTVVNSVFTGNYSGDHGIIHKKSGTSKISGSTFSYNYGTNNGILSSQGSKGSEWVYVSGTAEDEMLFLGNTANAGGAIWSGNGRGAFNVKGATFSENLAKSSGGVAYVDGQFIVGNGSDGTRTLFAGNTANNYGGAIYHTGEKSTASTSLISKLEVANAIFTGNISYANGGGAIAALYDMTLTGNTFVENYTGANGGALYIIGGSATLTDNYFSGNTANGDGGAVYIAGSSATLTDSYFTGNSANSNGGAVSVTASAALTLNGATFATAKDTVYVAGALTLQGNIEVHADVEKTETGSITVAENAVLTFADPVSVATLTFSNAESNSIVFADSFGVKFSDQDLSKVNISVIGDVFGKGSFTIAENITLGSDKTITVGGTDYVLNQSFDHDSKVYRFTNTGSNLNLECVEGDRIVFTGVGDGKNFLTVVKGNTAELSNIIVENFQNVSGPSGAIDNAGTLEISNAIFRGNSAGSCVNGEGAYGRGGAIYNTGTLTVRDSQFIDNKYFSADVYAGNSYGGGAIANHSGVANIYNCYFKGNGLDSTSVGGRGTTFRIHGGTLSVYGGIFESQGSGGQNCVIYDHNKSAGKIYINGYTDADGVLHDAIFRNNVGSIVDGWAPHVTVRNAQFLANTRYALVIVENSGYAGKLDLQNAKFNGNAGAISIKASPAVIADAEFLTQTDTIYHEGLAIANNSNLEGVNTLTFKGSIKLNASFTEKEETCEVANYADDAHFIFGNTTAINFAGLTFSDINAETGKSASEMTFNGTAKVAFTEAGGQDLSAINITVDGSLYDGSDVTIATGVSAIGEYTITDNPFLTLEVDASKNLVLKELVTEITPDADGNFTGDGVTVMDNGAVGTFFATKDNESEIATKISGGKVEQNLVGGAYVSAGNDATVNSVELIIGGTAGFADGSRAYAGGYLYGNAEDAEAADEAQLTVGKVNVNLTGGTVGGNLYGGAHARDNGNAKVEMVDITVTAGNHGRIYAGGWAEKGAVSSVGTSTVIISGGTVDYLYGGGANADGTTTVGTTTITIENDAVVNTIFMSGRYGYSWVDNVSLTFDGKAKVLKRLSGVSSAGMDYAKSTTVELATDVTADLIDYVDKFVINEDCTLTANDAFYLGNRLEGGAKPDVTTFDFIAEGDANWTAVAGISDFTNAKFAVNGSEAQLWDGTAAIEIGGYELTYDAEKKTITLANA